MRIQGQIEEGVLVNLLQYLNLNSATGVLRVQSPRGVSGAIYMAAGQVVHADTQALEGVPALVSLLAWKAGRFAFQSATKAPKRTVNKPLDALLLEVAYQTDHSVDPGAVQLGADTVLAPASLAANQQGKRVALPLVAIRMLPHLNGVTPLGTVAANLGVTLEDLLSAATILLDNDLASVSEGRLLDEEFIHNLTVLVRDIMGPLADIVMDESLDELGATASSVPEAQLHDLLELLAQEFPGQLRATFKGRVEALLRAHGLGSSR
ncbi:MAG: DUF4388 domain-containing protein [Trueperaceae bacterium]